MASSNDNNDKATPHTYVAGEDQGRLVAAAADLGLDQARAPQKQSWSQLLFANDTLTAARMHSVGCLGADERVDEQGTLHHIVTLRQRRRKPAAAAATDLTSLFAKPGKDMTGEKGTAAEALEEAFEVEGEEEEEVEVDMVEGGSLTSAVFGVIKATIGPAILYLPAGFYTSGYAVAIPAMLIATGMYILNAYRLLDCWKVESQRNHAVQDRLREVQALLAAQPSAQYGATALQQERYFTPKLLTYPELAKRALGAYSIIVECGIALFQFGVCLTYLIFVPDNLRAALASCGQRHVSKTVLLWMMIGVQIPLSWIRDIRKLTPTNVMASFLIAFGLAAVLVMAVWDGTRTGDSGDLVFQENLATLRPLTDTWFLFIGTSFFMMEGSITLLVPLQEAVYKPQDREKFPDVNRNVTWWIVAFYIVFSAIACAAFGQGIQTALTASLQGTLATIVQLAYSIAVILTFPLQAFPAMEVALRVLQQATSLEAARSEQEEQMRHNIFSTTIVLALGVVAVCAMEYLGNVVSILGSLFGIPLALVFPPLMHNALVKDSSWQTRWVNYSVVVVGIFAMASASFNTIVTWDSSGEG